MKRNLLLCIIVAIAVGCEREPVTPTDLLVAEFLAETDPARALHMLDSLSAKYRDADEYARNKYLLFRIKAKDKLYQPIGEDTVIKELTLYFDRHGTLGDKVESHYYLGGYYRDRNDYPHAVHSYRCAVDFYESHRPDSIGNVRTIAYAYAQLGGIHVQLEQLRLARDYIEKEYGLLKSIGAVDFFTEMDMGRICAITGDSLRAREHYLLAENMRRGGAMEQLEMGGVAEIMEFFVRRGERGRADSCAHVLDRYAPRQLPPNAWSCKSEYHERYGSMDSVEYYLRLYNEHPRTLSDYKGTASRLFYLYKNKGNLAEAVRYAEMYDHASDSLTLQNNRQASINADNFFQYERNMAEENYLKMESLQNRMLFWIWMCVALGAALVFIVVYGKMSRRVRRQLEEKRALEEEIMLLEKKAKEMEAEWLDELEAQRMAPMTMQEIVEYFKGAGFHKKYEDIDVRFWQQLYNSVNGEYPRFEFRMKDVGEVLSEENFRICYLLKAGIKPADVARIFGFSRSTATRRRKELAYYIN